MSKKYNKGYTDGFYDGYIRACREFSSQYKYEPSHTNVADAAWCVMCGGNLNYDFSCGNPACPASKSNVPEWQMNADAPGPNKESGC